MRHGLSPRIGLGWVVRFRWVGLLLAGIAFAGLGLGEQLVVGWVPVSLLLGVIAISNIALARVASRHEREATGAVLALDSLILTGLLALSGGPSNPFSVLYLVYVTLSAVHLGRGWTWSMVALTCACFASLFVWPSSESATHAMAHHHGAAATGFDLHLYGMLLAFIVAAVLIAYLVTLVAQTLRERESALRLAQDRAARSERVAALTSLAAGAAHELGSPLGTIAVAASELSRRAERVSDDETIQDDANLIESEVRRCRSILDRMVQRAGALTGESSSSVDPQQLVEDLRADLTPEFERRLQVQIDPELKVLSLPPRAMRQALLNLVQNAFDASPSGQPVSLHVRRQLQRVRFVVKDEGKGMEPDLVERAGEPFLTTKGAGHGLGLGLFLAKTLAERLDGELELASTPGNGTTATLDLPA